MTSIPFFGEILALITAVVWAFAVILFKKSGETVHPIALNLFKNVLSAALLLPTLWLFGESLLHDAPPSHYAIMLLSGCIGIGIADTLFFYSLNTLGAGLSAVVDCFYSPSMIVMAMIFLGETLTLWQVVGVALIISAILTGTTGDSTRHIPPRQLVKGILFGMAAVTLIAASIIIVKPVLAASPVLWVTEWRLIGGILILLVGLTLRRDRAAIVRSATHVHRWGYMVSGSFVGAYLSMMLWLGGMKFTQASTASALNQTTNVFIFIFAAVFLREPITLLRSVAIALGVAGAYLVMFG